MNADPTLTVVPASPASLAAFFAIVIAVIAAFLAGTFGAYRGQGAPGRVMAFAAFGLGLWLALLMILVISGRMPQLPLAGLPFFFGSILLVVGTAGLSNFGRQLAAGLPLAALVGFQAFRLPLELVLHSWASQGTIPETMTWTGRNWDIVSGAVALLAAPFANRHRGAAWAANLIGGVLLLNVMRVALLSAPVSFGWHTTPPLLLPFNLPYALIGPICVGGALLGHIVLTRALLRAR